MARSATTSDVFNAVADTARRAVIDALAGGEQSVGDLVDLVSLTQPQVSKHLRVLGEVGVVRLRIDGRRHLYSLDGAALLPMVNWLAGLEWQWNGRFDRIDDLLTEIQRGPDDGDGAL